MISSAFEGVSRVVLVICWAVVLIGGLPSSGLAQTAEELAEARNLVIEAERAAQEGDTQRARALYRDAFDLSEEPRLIYRVAQLDEERSNPSRAVRHYRLYLKLEPDAAYRERIEARITKLEESQDAMQSWVVVQSVPGNASVYVTSAERVRCKTPCRVAVDPGESKLIVRKDGYASAERMVYAAPGEEQTETFDLQPLQAPVETELSVREVGDAPPEKSTEEKPRVIFEVEESQIDYVRSGPPTFASFLGWTSLLTGFWALVMVASPGFPEATTTLALVGAAGAGLGSYLLFIHPWGMRDDAAQSRSDSLQVGAGFEF